jgi:hypothetical protein
MPRGSLWLAAGLLLLGACPDQPPGRPCDGNVDCPTGQRCDEATFFCVDAPVVDAGAGDAGAPDAGCLCVSDEDCSDPERFCDGRAVCLCDRCEIVSRCEPDGDAPVCFDDEQRCVGCLVDDDCEPLESATSGPYVCDAPLMSCVLAADAGS